MHTLRRLLGMMLVAFVALLMFAGIAAAQVAPDGDVTPDTNAGATLTINNLLVTLLTALILPAAIGFVQKPTNPGWVKVIVMAVLVGIANGISEGLQDDGSAILSQEWAVDYLLMVGATIASYLGVWDPLLRNRGGVNVATGSGLMPQVGAASSPP